MTAAQPRQGPTVSVGLVRRFQRPGLPHLVVPRRHLSAVVMLVCLFLFGTGPFTGPSPGLAVAGGTDPVALDYRLKWLFNTSVAGDIFALDQGSFADQGLAVRVKEGSPEKDAIKELELGYADFGVASADQVIRALDQGADVIVLAQLFQVNPMQWIYRADQPEVTALTDLKHRRLGVTFGGNDDTIMKTLLARAGLTFSDVRITGVRFDFTPFLKNQVDLWPVYRNSQGVILSDQLARAGESVRFFNPADFGVDFVANSVVTSGRMIQERPQVAARFLTALLAGWTAAMDPSRADDVLAAVKKRDTGVSDDIRRRQLDATRPLIQPHPDTPIGQIQEAAWKQTESIMRSQGLIHNPVHVVRRLRPLSSLPRVP